MGSSLHELFIWDEAAEWYMTCVLVLEDKYGHYVPFSVKVIGLDANGNGIPSTNIGTLIRCKESTADSVFGSLAGREGIFKGADPMEYPATGTAAALTLIRLADSLITTSFLALSFLNCRNVKSVNCAPDHKFSMVWRKQHQYSLVTYKTLCITPMTEVLRREGGKETHGISKALHICRGHFKSYEERGLFGREDLRGRFWWANHVRGRAERGIVEKDYKLAVPEVVEQQTHE
jgi:hypothetical protein